jgi:F0F1-type ATP synthase delta subunit
MKLMPTKSIQPLSQKSTGFLLNMLFLIISTALMSSCSEFLRGAPVKPDYVELKSGSLGCLNDVSADVQNFFNSTSSNAEIDATFTCLDSTLTEFQTRVEGRAQADAFNVSELYDIFQKFISSASISRDAAKSLLLLKAAIFGGDSSKITKAEIGDLKKYLVVIKGEAKKLQPYLKLLAFTQPDTPYTQSFINDGFAQLNTSLKTLYSASKFSNSNYSFEDFKNLILNLNVLKSDQNSLVKVANKLNFLINGNQALSDSDRLAYIDNITEVLRLYAVMAQGYVKFQITTAADLNATFDFIDNVIKLLENSLQYKKTRMLSAQSIDALVTEVVNSNLLSVKISSSDAITFYKTAVVRVLETGFNGVPTISGIGRVHLVNLKREIAVFKIYSKMIEKITGSSTQRFPIATVQRQLQAMSPADEVDILAAFDTSIQAQIIAQVNELKAEFSEASPTIYRYKKMAIAANQETWDQNWEDLESGVYTKILVRLLTLGWGSNVSATKEIKNAYLTEAGMVKWYAEFKAFGIAVKFLDPRVDNLGSSDFIAGNLFTRSGNGDTKLTFKEAIENFGALLSGGVAATEMQADLEKAHCHLPELDVMGQHWNSESCVYTVLRANYRFYFSNLSYLVAFLDRQNEAQFKSFFQQMLDISRNYAGNKGVRVESSDISGMNTLLHFMEGLYAVHDLNRNWALSESEIKQGYPKFQSFATDFARKSSASQIKQFTGWEGKIAGYGCFKEADLIRESFVFLVYNGRTPGLGDLNKFPCFLGKSLIKFTGEVDRMRILNAFKVIKSALGS